MGNKSKAYITLTAAMIIVGSSVVVGKIMVKSFPVFLASGLRFLIASVILVPLMLKAEKGMPDLSKKEIVILFLQALTGVFGFSIFLLYGLKLTSAAESGIITSTTPAVIGIISFLFLKEKLNLNKVVGIALSVLGIVAINVFGSNQTSGSEASYSLLGNLLIFGAVVGEALFTIFGKVVSKRINPLAISTFVTVFGFLLFLPFSIYEAVQFDFTKTTFTAWISVIYYAVVVTVIGFFLWYKGVAQVAASTSAVFTGILPVSALFLSYLILGEAFQWFHLIGVSFVLVGIGFIAIERKSMNESKNIGLHDSV